MQRLLRRYTVIQPCRCTVHDVVTGRAVRAGAANADATAALVRFSDELGISVANIFHGKRVMPGDHSDSLGTIGVMRNDYVSFGFDNTDVIIAVGYKLQEFDLVWINPRGYKKII